MTAASRNCRMRRTASTRPSQTVQSRASIPALSQTRVRLRASFKPSLRVQPRAKLQSSTFSQALSQASESDLEPSFQSGLKASLEPGFEPASRKASSQPRVKLRAAASSLEPESSCGSRERQAARTVGGSFERSPVKAADRVSPHRTGGRRALSVHWPPAAVPSGTDGAVPSTPGVPQYRHVAGRGCWS